MKSYKKQLSLNLHCYEGSQDGIEVGQAEHCSGYVATRGSVRGRLSMQVAALDVMVKAVDGIADHSAPEESDGDVAREVDAEVEARPAVDKRPGDEQDGEEPLPHEQGEEEGDGEGVAGVCGEESVVAAAVAVDGVDEHAYLRIATGSPAGP